MIISMNVFIMLLLLFSMIIFLIVVLILRRITLQILDQIRNIDESKYIFLKLFKYIPNTQLSRIIWINPIRFFYFIKSDDNLNNIEIKNLKQKYKLFQKILFVIYSNIIIILLFFLYQFLTNFPKG